MWSLHKSGRYSRRDLIRLMNLTILETSSFEATVGPGGGGSHGEARWAGFMGCKTSKGPSLNCA